LLFSSLISALTRATQSRAPDEANQMKRRIDLNVLRRNFAMTRFFADSFTQ